MAVPLVDGAAPVVETLPQNNPLFLVRATAQLSGLRRYKLDENSPA